MNSPALREDQVEISLEEAVALSADSPTFYGRFFFPKAIRQESPHFHEEMWDHLLSAERFVSFMIFRGGAKTTITRVYLSFIVAFALSRTILIVGKSQDAAARTVEWLQRAVEFNHKWAQAFGLRKGDKWNSTEIDIWHGTDEVPIRVIALGITGSVRGVNVDDYRPDAIIVDDPCDEENTATPEQRKKISSLFFGAIAKSLAPASEAPLAKMVLLQTPLNREDLINLTVKDRQWLSLVYPCFNANGESQWPSRWTTAELQADKQAHIDRGDLPLWLREMECKIVDDSTAAFPSSLMAYWEVLPDQGRTILAVDPTPPPSNTRDIAKSADLDDACIMVLREFRGEIYVCDYYVTKSPDPDEFISAIFQMAVKWQSREIAIETVLFARTTKHLLEKEMLRRRQWLVIQPMEDRRAKPIRLRQEIKPLYTLGKIKFHTSQGELIEQLTQYPSVNHDDIVDALAIGLQYLSNWEGTDEDGELLEGEIEAVDWVPGCP